MKRVTFVGRNVEQQPVDLRNRQFQVGDGYSAGRGAARARNGDVLHGSPFDRVTTHVLRIFGTRDRRISCQRRWPEI